MAKVNIEFDGKIYSVDENTLTSLASPLERALVQQLAGTGAVIRFGGNDYNVDANKLASTRNVLTDQLSNVEGTDSKVTVNGVEYGLSKTKLQDATDKMNGTLDSVSIKPSEGLEYSLNEDGQSYSVVGIGTCEDADLIIPDTYKGLPVTHIGYEAFSYNEAITTIIIPDSVTSIRTCAFEGCNSLTSVTMGDSVTSIGDNVFKWCDSLASITIPDSVTDIGAYAFCCTSITSITIPDSVTSMGKSAFSSCPSLTDVTIGNGVTSIGNFAFEWCTSLTNVTIGNGVTSIGDAAFNYCTSLTSVMIGNSVTKIVRDAFRDCSSLTSITIPDSVTSIGSEVFYGCTSLADIHIGKPENSISGTPWGAPNATIHWNSTGPEDEPETPEEPDDGPVPGLYETGSNYTVLLKTWDELLAANAFGVVDKTLTTVIVPPDNLPEKNEYGFYYGVRYYNWDMYSPGTDWADYIVFYPDGTSEYYNGDYIEKSSDARYSAGVIECDLHGYMPRKYATYDVLSDGLQIKEQSSGYSISWTCGTFTRLTDAGDLLLPADGSVTSIEAAFDKYSNLTSVTIPDSVTSIGSDAFAGCSSLTSVTIGNGVTSIGESAFGYCENLTSVTLGNSVESIGAYAFQSCFGLKSIVIPDSVTSIDNTAFDDIYDMHIYINKPKNSISGAPWVYNYGSGVIHWSDEAEEYLWDEGEKIK